ncbi:MAG: flagellar basal body L-ring protein FlgH [Deltaproteobacteria bacterium]|nr:flagellar basal body L-ring protein FlgH [Deltaproteobacteria bacterium]MCB9489010.1 flagellar basal body L-ring protein FlgH [Deltaproteobacteria bacterium]
MTAQTIAIKRPQLIFTAVRAIVAFVVFSLLLSLGTGCAARRSASAGEPLANGYKPVDFAVPAEEVPREHRRSGASLWVDNNQSNWLYSDHKARHINDVVTVQVVEESDAKGKAKTKTDKTSTIGAGVDGFFGAEQLAARRNPNLKLDTLVGAKTGTKFDGKGETSRSGSLVTTISCLVVDVLPNGNLVVRGERSLTINGEDINMVLTGIVRPRDIASNNVVVSTMIADARIEYFGKGVLADKMNPGWFTRAFEKVWPF